MKRQTFASLALVAVAALALSACGSNTEDSGIASVDQSTSQPDATATSGTSEDQALAFSQCMRDNGVDDFPDPTVDADGNPSFQDAFQSGSFDPGDDSFRTALDSCQSLIGDLTFGGGRPGGDFDPEAIQDSLYQYTQCLRDQGLDVGDITFDGAGPGGGTGDGAQPTAPPTDGAAPGGQAGPGGDITDRFAEQLGQDPDDPAWIAASEACQSVLDEALAGVGGPASGTNG